jgi:hypothetical protein
LAKLARIQGIAFSLAALAVSRSWKSTFSCFVVNNLEVPVHKAAELLPLAVNP